MRLSWDPRLWSRRTRLITATIVLGPLIVVFSTVLFGFVLPLFGNTENASVAWERIHEKTTQHQQSLDSFWIDKKPGLSFALDTLIGLALVAVALWGLYKVFMYFCTDLDAEGRWNSLIASRRTGHHHRWRHRSHH